MSPTNATARTDRALVLALAAAVPPPGSLDHLRARLAHDANVAGLLEVAYRTVDSPIGPLLVAATAQGLVRVAFELEDHDAVLTELAAVLGPRILRDGGVRTDPVARQLDEYFAGQRHDFDVAVDLRLVHGFRRQVIEHLSTIAYGETASYGDVARAAGNPGAVRAVGTACGRNPVPVVVPCHRVVRSDGSMGQYRGGVEAKATLLALESAA